MSFPLHRASAGGGENGPTSGPERTEQLQQMVWIVLAAIAGLELLVGGWLLGHLFHG